MLSSPKRGIDADAATFRLLDQQIAIDTREPIDTAYDFGDLPTRRIKLDSADYSVVGYENRLGLERKTVEDHIGSLTRERERFERELERLAAFERALILVE